MTTIKTSKGEFLFVEVPLGAWSIFETPDGCLEYNTKGNLTGGEIELPDDSGFWEAINSTEKMTEEQAAQVVEDNGMGCWDNYKGKIDERYTCLSALDSLKSLMRAKKMTRENYAILKRIS